MALSDVKLKKPLVQAELNAHVGWLLLLLFKASPLEEEVTMT